MAAVLCSMVTVGWHVSVVVVERTPASAAPSSSHGPAEWRWESWHAQSVLGPQFRFKCQMPWLEICKAEGREDTALWLKGWAEQVLVSGTVWTDRQDQGAHSTGHSGVLWPWGWQQVSPVRLLLLGAAVVCPQCWWRWCMAGAGGLMIVERAAACAGWASDAALGVSLVLPVPHEPLNTLQLIPFHSKPAREDSVFFLNWTLTEKRELHKQIS